MSFNVWGGVFRDGSAIKLHAFEGKSNEEIEMELHVARYEVLEAMLHVPYLQRWRTQASNEEPKVLSRFQIQEEMERHEQKWGALEEKLL